MIDIEQKRQLLRQSELALVSAYSPYSGNKVGAALLSSKGNIFLGANIGNACSSLNVCAEQVAISTAVMQSDLDFVAMAIVQSSGVACVPCGRCLQLLSEFADDMLILAFDGTEIIEHGLKALLPIPYRRSEKATTF